MEKLTLPKCVQKENEAKDEPLSREVSLKLIAEIVAELEATPVTSPEWSKLREKALKASADLVEAIKSR